MKAFLLSVAVLFSGFIQAYDFHGTHFMASYKECQAGGLSNVKDCVDLFVQAVEASGATVLKVYTHEFEGGGFTTVILLSESHASIHTYPEHAACFVDLFTCGSHTSFEPFHTMLINFLVPGEVSREVSIRN